MSYTPQGQDHTPTEPSPSQAPAGRRWYHLRPEPRNRADVLGVNRTWWTALWIVLILVIVFLPW
jgi:hypothetical protein